MIRLTAIREALEFAGARLHSDDTFDKWPIARAEVALAEEALAAAAALLDEMDTRWPADIEADVTLKDALAWVRAQEPAA